MCFIKRRYRLAIILFSFCLSALLFFSSNQAASLTVVNTDKPDTPLSITDNVRKTVLANGLTVLTKEIPTAPVVSVQVWYQIGSRNEASGVNGIAHQLEHMLFKGTSDRPIQFGRLFSALGSDSNAFTSYDQTAYFGTVERNKLEALLTLEADRMQNALIDAAQLDSEKRVVISELQGYENEPDYRLSRAVMQAAFPTNPYGLPIGGTKADVQSFTVEQVREYYRNYYAPSNATLVIAGDFDTETVLTEVQEIFGKIPNQEQSSTRGSRYAPLRSRLASPKPVQTTPIILREPGAAALLQAVYPLPSVNHPDVPALDVMDYILTEGRNSRLYQALIESGLASDAGGYVASMIGMGWYNLTATAAPGQPLTKIDAVMQQAVAQLRENGVTPEEVNRAKALVKSTVVLSNRDVTSQAMQLGYDQTTAGDYRYSDRYLAAIDRVSAADVQRVAQQYLQDQNRTVGLFEPTVIEGQPSSNSGGTQTHESFLAGSPVDPAEVAKYLPPIDSTATPTARSLPEKFQLRNGLEVLLVPDDSTPTVTLSGLIKAGSEYDTNAKAGLAALTADNLINGTKDKNALELARALEDRGAILEFAAFREGVDITGYSLTSDLPVLIETLSDVVQNATFPTKEFELAQQRAVTNLQLELDSPATVARRKFQQAIYPPNHPYHNFPTLKSLQQLRRDDVVDFYQKHYRADQTILTLVGDFEPKQVRSLFEKQFLSWRTHGQPPSVNYPQILPPKAATLNSVLPGKAQSVTFIGYKGIDRQDPRYYSALVLNQILGGDTLSSRLGTEIRDRLGLTYGIYSYFQAGRHAGPFLIQMQTAPEDTQRAIASTVNLLQQTYRQGVTPNELDTAKRSLTSSYTVSLANPDELANQILSNEVYGLSVEELRTFNQKLQAVTLAQVNQAAKELLQVDNTVVVTAGPGK